jgi:hypothetical protein
MERTVPRIRLPGYSALQPNGSNPVGQPFQSFSTTPPATFVAGPHVAQLTALPPLNVAGNFATIPTASDSPDGFRPRGSGIR